MALDGVGRGDEGEHARGREGDAGPLARAGHLAQQDEGGEHRDHRDGRHHDGGGAREVETRDGLVPEGRAHEAQHQTLERQQRQPAGEPVAGSEPGLAAAQQPPEGDEDAPVQVARRGQHHGSDAAQAAQGDEVRGLPAERREQQEFFDELMSDMKLTKSQRRDFMRMLHPDRIQKTLREIRRMGQEPPAEQEAGELDMENQEDYGDGGIPAEDVPRMQPPEKKSFLSRFFNT